MCAEKVDVDRAGLAVAFELEVMVLEVGEAVAHVRLSALDVFLPEDLVPTPNVHVARDGGEVRANHELRAKAAGAELGAGKIQVIALFKLMVGELVANGETSAVRCAVCADQIDAGELGFFAAVFGVRRNGEGFK